MVTVANLAAVGLALVVFTALADLMVMQFARGVATAVAEAGARRVALGAIDPVGCRDEVTDVVWRRIGDQLAGLPAVRCGVVGGWARIEVHGVLRGITPLVPDLEFRAGAVMPVEP